MRFSFPVCLERLSIESLDISKIRVECHRVVATANDKNSPTGSSNWSDSDLLTFDKNLESEGVPWQENEIMLNYIFTPLVHITILGGFSDFCVIQRVRFFGIKMDIFQQTS